MGGSSEVEPTEEEGTDDDGFIGWGRQAPEVPRTLG